MPGIWEDLQQPRHAALKRATALAACCLLAILVLSLQALVSSASLQLRLDRGHALEAAQQSLLASLSQRDTARLEQGLEALLKQSEFAFRYLAVRDLDGSVLAVRGRYEALNRNAGISPALRGWLRARLYSTFGEAGVLTLQAGDRRIGSLDYAIGLPSAQRVREQAVDRLRLVGWAGGALSLLFAAAILLLLRAALAGALRPAAPPRSQAPAAGSGRVAPSIGPAGDIPPAAFDSLALGMLELDAELQVRLINDTAAALTGWAPQDARGQLIYTVFRACDDAGAPILSPGEVCVRTGASQPPMELRLRPRNAADRDQERVVEARAMPSATLRGGACMLFEDVSARAAERERLRTQALIAQGVIDHLLEAVLTTDTAGVIRSANTRALRMFGYGSEELQRMTVARLLPVPFMNTPGLKLVDYVAGGQARLPKLAGWRKDATTFPAELVVEPMRIGSDQQLVVIIRDITERLRSQSLAQRLGRLLDSASEEVYIFDAQSLYFIEVNKGARRNLGLKPDQLARMSLASIATDLDPLLLQGHLARLRSGEAEHLSYRANHRRHDGSTYPVEVRLSFSRDEEPPVFMAIALDISQRATTE